MARTLPQAEPVHDAAHVIGIVADAQARLDGLGEARRGPAVAIEARGTGPGDRFPPRFSVVRR